MDWILKGFLGAALVLVLQLLARSRCYYLAGLVPLFPTFSLVSHYLVGTQRTVPELRVTILFGMAAVAPYFVYLFVLYLVVGRLNIVRSLVVATFAWLLCAVLLVRMWNQRGSAWDIRNSGGHKCSVKKSACSS